MNDGTRKLFSKHRGMTQVERDEIIRTMKSDAEELFGAEFEALGAKFNVWEQEGYGFICSIVVPRADQGDLEAAIPVDDNLVRYTDYFFPTLYCGKFYISMDDFDFHVMLCKFDRIEEED